MGFFNRKKKESSVSKTIQQELIDFVDASGKTQIADDYIRNTIFPNYRIQYEKAKAVVGIIFLAEKDTNSAREKYDYLLKSWVEELDMSENYQVAPHLHTDIAFFCGLLAANNVIPKQDFDNWNLNCLKLADEAENRFLNRARENYLKNGNP
ncbi:MAG: hypothetical protein IJV40_05260 [Oscillospiraceae bacterium]|nr:hypothetical protein [Oscillospiraceae bacterium]